MELWNSIRQRVLREKVSIRQIQRETGLHFNTIKKILEESKPPAFKCPERKKPKIGPYLDRIASFLQVEKDENWPKKQRHTAKRIFERLQEEGYEGGYTQVKEAVRALRRTSQEVFVPLAHRPGEAQVDFGEALVHLAGEMVKVAFFVMVLPFSDAFFVVAYRKECTETFQDGHVRSFEFFGGVPGRISYDNAKTSISQILGPHKRKLTKGFLELQSHYLFKEHFCRVYRPNEKGVVESMVKFTRLNFFVPVPEVQSMQELNYYLARQCHENLTRHVRGKPGTKQDRLVEDQAAFLTLPPAPYEAFSKASTRANRLSLVRFKDNDYSVPVRYAHHSVVVKGYVDKVRICLYDEVIAEHERLWGKEGVQFNPVHYLALIERKPGALHYARPLEEWELPGPFFLLQGRLEEDGDLDSTQCAKEYIKVLRLLERYPVEKVAKAIKKALKLSRVNYDVVAQFLYTDDWPLLTFSLDGREQLQGIRVAPPDLAAYEHLMGGLN